ncbi:MAG: DnaB helicase C-terminal domain-containing protein [Candidatus Magnetoovum sp. WYHC-5]|nr:DnaB helicase C-terminal domain-containing protein [Candidatus Magnetoovum sp. WYHC-5]
MEEKGYLMQREYDPIVSLKDEWNDFIDEIGSKDKEFAGFKTGLEDLDKALNGLQGLIVLGGLPGVGKTTLALQMALSVLLKHNTPMIYYTLDTEKTEIMVKLLSHLSKIPYQIFKTKNMDALDTNKFDRQAYLDYIKVKEDIVNIYDKIFIINAKRSQISTVKIRSQATKIKQLTNASSVFIVVDYIENFPVEVESPDSLTKYDNLLTTFKELQIELNACILIVSRKSISSYKDYQRGNFKGALPIEYKGDSGLLLVCRNESEKPTEPDKIKKCLFNDYTRLENFDFNPISKQEMSLMIIKNRFGITGQLSLTFYPELARFEQKK